MKFVVDHDYHIHSYISSCSGDPLQTPERILQYAKDNGLRKICLTDHFWDEGVEGASGWYRPQNFSHISAALPLPQDDGVEFVFGCETELNKELTLGLSREMCDRFGFIIIPTTHLHMKNFTIDEDATLAERAEAYVMRLESVLYMDLPFHKIGIAHLTCHLIARKPEGAYLDVIDMVSDADFERLFTRAAEVGVGIELNFDPNLSEEDMERGLRPYRIAKRCGCKFYVGSDAHHEKDLHTCYQRLCKMVELLELEESDKFNF